MKGNIRFGSIFGIPFYLNPSWFIVLALVTLDYGYEVSEITHLPGLVPWTWGLIIALLLFSSVLVHELGHSLVAISQGIKVKSITLFLFGGLAILEKESKRPLESLLVAIAGPLVSLIFFVILTLINNNLQLPLVLRLVVQVLASINLVLGLFNLIPGLPLDGGNILKAIVWKITGNPNKGILFASRFGQAFGYIAIAIGVLSVFKLIHYGSIWTILIGFFLLQNANLAAQSVQVKENLEGFTALDVMIDRGPIASDNLNLREFANTYVIGQKPWKRFLLKDATGKLSGILTVESLKNVPTSLWSKTLVSQIQEEPENLVTILSSTPLLEVIISLEQQINSAELIVLSQTDELLGLIDRISIAEFLQKRALTLISPNT